MPKIPPPPAPTKAPESPSEKRPARPHRAEDSHDEAGERAILGAVLCDATALTIARKNGLTPAAFYVPALRSVYSAMLALSDRAAPVDAITVSAELKSVGVIDSVGGAVAVERLMDGAVILPHVAYHVEKVMEHAERRRLATALPDIARALSSGGSSEDARERIRVLLESGTAATGRRFPEITSAADFMAEEIPEPAQLVHGVLHAGSKAVYGGPSKAFKSWTLLDLCMSVASGAPWLGFDTTASRVLYVNFELQPFAIQHRLDAIARARSLDVPDTLHLWHLRGYACPLTDLLPELLRRAADEGYELIVPDPVYKTLAGRDENSAGDIGTVCQELENVAVQTGAAIAFGAHFAKGNASGKESIDRISGSGVWARDPDAIITASPHETDGAFAVEMTLRNFPPPRPFVVRWEFPLMRLDEALDPSQLRQTKATKPARAKTLVNLEELGRIAARVVKDKPLPVSVFNAAFAREARLSDHALRDAKAELFHTGDVVTITARREPRPDGRKYVGTPKAILELEAKWLSPNLEGLKD